MNNRRDFDKSNLDGAPTMAAPAAGQQQGGWPQQAPYGEPGPYPSTRKPGVMVGGAAAAALLAVAALIATWQMNSGIGTTPADTEGGVPQQQVQVPVAPVQEAPAPAAPAPAPPSAP